MEYTSGDYSRHYIVQALFKLMETDDYTDIRVTDICAKAGVGRATFYRYFPSKEAVIKFYFESRNTEFKRGQQYKPRCKEDYLDIIENVVDALEKNKREIRLLQKAHLEYLYFDFMNEGFIELFKNELDHGNLFLAAGYSGAIFNISMRWVQSDCQEDKSLVVSAIEQITFGGRRTRPKVKKFFTRESRLNFPQPKNQVID